MSLFSTSARFLTRPEIDLVKRVFRGTVPYDRVVLRDNTGFSQSAFVYKPTLSKFYYMHVGAEIYLDATSEESWSRTPDGGVRGRRCDVFVHELAHVWQGEHRRGFVMNSLWHQLIKRNPYQYRCGAAWEAYNVEQQASIVEDWFNKRIGGESVSDPRFRYMAEHIWKSKPR